MLLFVCLISCRRNTSDKSKLSINDSLFKYYTIITSSPNYFLLTYKTDSTDKGVQICVDTERFGKVIKRNHLKHFLQFDEHKMPYIIDSASFFYKKLAVAYYDFTLVDSLDKFLLPTIADSIRKESINPHPKLLWDYYIKFDKYFIHALLRHQFSVYQNKITGFPMLLENKK